MLPCDDAGTKKDSLLSKKLSWLLRHGAHGAGVKMRPDGYVAVPDVLALPQFHNMQLSDILRVVQYNEKKRFGLITEDDVLYVRAQQGHSIKGLNDSLLLERISSPSEIRYCIHGTYRSAWEWIAKAGLSRMNRNHIHFSPGLPEDKGVISGMRKSCEIYIYMNVERAMNDGARFYRSKNNVILSDGFGGVIPCRYFEKVVDVEAGLEISLIEAKTSITEQEEE